MIRSAREVAVGTAGAADADGFVGQLHLEGLAVGLGVNGESLDAEFAAGAHDAQGDFAAVGDEDILNHGRGEEDEGRTLETSAASGGVTMGNGEEWFPTRGKERAD